MSNTSDSLKMKKNLKGGGEKKGNSDTPQNCYEGKVESSDRKQIPIRMSNDGENYSGYSVEQHEDDLIIFEDRGLVEHLRVAVDEKSGDEFKDEDNCEQNGMAENVMIKSRVLENTRKNKCNQEIKIEEKVVNKNKDKFITKVSSVTKESVSVAGSSKLDQRKNTEKLTTKAKIAEAKVFDIDEHPRNSQKPLKDPPSPIKKSNPESKNRRMPKSDSKNTISSSIDRIFTEQTNLEIKKSRESLPSSSTPDLSRRTQNTSIKSKSPSVSPNLSPLKKFSSSVDLNATTIIKVVIAPNYEKGETIYDKFHEIAQQPRPDISPRREATSKSPTRTTEEIDQMLYGDAMRRASIQHEHTEYPEVTTNIRSQQVLAKKFIKNFLQALEELNISTEKLEIRNVISLLSRLSLMKTDLEDLENEDSSLIKFWKYIQSEEMVSKERFISCSLAVSGIFASQISVESFTAFQDLLDLKAIGSSLKFEEELKLHKAFFNFYENRQILPKPSKAYTNTALTHRPQLSEESELLAKIRKGDIGEIWTQKRMDYFLQEKKKLLEKAAKIKEENVKEELSKCTFQPKISGNSKKMPKKITPREPTCKHHALVLYKKSKACLGKIKSTKEIEMEKNLAECTFTPKIARSNLKEDIDALYSRSVQKNLIRLQKAREEEARKKSILEGPAEARHFNLDVAYNRIKSPLKPSVPRSNPKSPDRLMPMISLSGSDINN